MRKRIIFFWTNCIICLSNWVTPACELTAALQNSSNTRSQRVCLTNSTEEAGWIWREQCSVLTKHPFYSFYRPRKLSVTPIENRKQKSPDIVTRVTVCFLCSQLKSRSHGHFGRRFVSEAFLQTFHYFGILTTASNGCIAKFCFLQLSLLTEFLKSVYIWTNNVLRS